MKRLLLMTIVLCVLPLWVFAQVQSVHPDSIVETNAAGQNISKNVYTYDTNGNPTLHLFYEWDVYAGLWKEKEMEETEYTTFGKPDNTILSVKANGEWMLSEKTQYFYEAAVCTLKVVSNWDEDNAIWSEQEKEEFTLGSDGKPTLMIQYEMVFNPSSTAAWQTSEKSAYTYSGGKLSRVVNSYYESNQWYLENATNYTYNGNNLSQEEDFLWDSGSSQWNQSEKTVYSYGSNGGIAKEEIYEWINNAYMLERISNYFYPVLDGIDDSEIESSVQPYAALSGSDVYLYRLPEDAQLALYTSSGAMVRQMKSSSETCRLPLPARGEYFIVITADSERSVLKIAY